MISIDYIAGFFDGEGSVGIYGSGRRATLRATFTQVRSPESIVLVQCLVDRYGGGVAPCKKSKPHHRAAFQWSLYGPKAAAFLRDVRDHLLLKQAQVDAVLAWYKSDLRGEDRMRLAQETMTSIRYQRSKGPERVAKWGHER